jgi:hypothetical protein
MHGFLDGMFSAAFGLCNVLLTLLFVILKLIGALVCSWLWILLPIFLASLFLTVATLPRAP